MLWGARANTSTTIKCWACNDANGDGQLTAVVGGNTFTGDTLNASNNWTGVVTITGLAADTSYSVALKLAGATFATESYKTLPSSGDVDLMFIFDADEAQFPYAALLSQESRLTIDACYMQEAEYIEVSEYSAAPASAAAIGQGTPNTGTGLRAAAAASPEDPLGASNLAGTPAAGFTLFRDSYERKHRYSRIRDATSGKKWRDFFDREFALRFMWDNHDIYTPQAAGDGGMPRPNTSQFDGAAQAAWEYYFQGNPVATGMSGDAEPNVLIAGVKTHKNFAYSERIADVEVFVTDWMTFSPMTTDFDDVRSLVNTTGGLSAWQLAWLTAAIIASTASVIVVVMSRPPQTAADSLAGSGTIASTDYTGASTGIIDALNQKTGKTVIMVTGDTHRPMMRLWSVATSHSALPIFEVNAGALRPHVAAPKIWQAIAGETIYFDPLGVTLGGDRLNHTGDDTLFSSAGRSACTWTYVRVKRRTGYTTVELRNAITCAVVATKTILDGARTPS